MGHKRDSLAAEVAEFLTEVESDVTEFLRANDLTDSDIIESYLRGKRSEAAAILYSAPWEGGW